MRSFSADYWIAITLTKTISLVYAGAEWIGADPAALLALYGSGIMSFALLRWVNEYTREAQAPDLDPPLVEADEDQEERQYARMILESRMRCAA